jgi:hypothetical protein
MREIMNESMPKNLFLCKTYLCVHQVLLSTVASVGIRRPPRVVVRGEVCRKFAREQVLLRQMADASCRSCSRFYTVSNSDSQNENSSVTSKRFHV